jgi:hypothetical protein
VVDPLSLSICLPALPPALLVCVLPPAQQCRWKHHTGGGSVQVEAEGTKLAMLSKASELISPEERGAVERKYQDALDQV